MSKETRHCHQCGAEWTSPFSPVRSETCERCGADLKVCINCVSYEPYAAFQCRDRRTEPVSDKKAGNFCELFEFIRRVYVPKNEESSRTQAAREQLKKLLE